MNDWGGPLRVVTWNIHGCVGQDGRHDAERVGAFIRAMAPDIAALQEVDERLPSPTQLDIYSYLRYQVGDHGHEAWSVSGADGRYGQMLASRFPLIDRQVHDVSVPGREPRKVMEARVELPCGPLRVIATHLGLRRDERRRQMTHLREIILEDLCAPAVLMGDLNEWPGRGGRHPLFDLFDGWTAHRSFPSRFPVLVLDRILCRAGLRLAESRAVREAAPASDHLPVSAQLVVA